MIDYGLPRDVKFCARCVISNQRPASTIEYAHNKDSKKVTIAFDENGVCDACRAVEAKKSINWNQREAELKDLCDRFRSKDGSHDCIVPGSGGKDSFYAAHMLKYKYGMTPLTVTWAPHIYTEWGWRNFQRWIHRGFDNWLCTPNGMTHRVITRLAVDNLFHPFQPFIIGQKAMAPKIAALRKIPLVFYGENEAEYGNPIEDNQKATRSWKYFTQDESKIHLGGASIKELKEDYGLRKADLEPYLPANPKDLKRVGVEVHYLGYYLKWHPQGAYYYACENGDFEPAPERNPGTYSKYNSIDDKIDDLHYFTTFVKFGIGRASYDAAQEIRNGEITRAEGVALVKRYDGEYPERFEDEVFSYLSPKGFKKLDRKSFMEMADLWRPEHLWRKDSNGAWFLKRQVS